MIRYALRCSDGHSFESWFANSAAYDRLAAAGHVICPDCGDTRIAKAPMAPNVASASAAPTDHPLARLRRRIEAESEDVGRNFAREARAIHEGHAPDRAIRGEATAAEASALLRDGAPVMPLPFVPRSKAN